MAQLVVRNLDDEVKAKLMRPARRNGRSTEAEVREILGDAVKGDLGSEQGLGTRIAARFKGIGLDQDIPELRGPPARPADFDE